MQQGGSLAILYVYVPLPFFDNRVSRQTQRRVHPMILKEMKNPV